MIVSFIFLFILCFTVSKREITVSVVDEVKIDRENFFKKVFAGVDYFLLLTFVAFFILIGNLQNIPFIYELFKNLIVGNELICGILVSQIISNVPAGVMLSGFSTNYKAIILGINIGGLGSLIASMANLISYKIFVSDFNNLKWKYIGILTAWNIVLLAILIVVYLFLG